MISRFTHIVLLAALALLPAAQASAGVILITQAKAVQGGVTPGDTAGFPVTLSRPGAYRFDTNLTVPAGKSGIAVGAHYVSIDMAGFVLSGFSGTQRVGLNGVYSAFGISSIRNGIITGFASNGIILNGNSNSWVVENMQILSNGGAGIDAYASAYSRFINNTVLTNGKDGIQCGSYCHVYGSNISDNAEVGVYIKSGTVLGNTIFSNGDIGIFDSEGLADTGFGNNTLIGNAGYSAVYVLPLHPNVCQPAC